MILKGTPRLFGSAICVAFALVLVSAGSCFGQSDQGPTTPRPVPTPPSTATGDANVGTSRAGNEGHTTATAIDDNSTRTTKVDKGRSLKEEMIVIDAATRKKQREREMANHDRTFDSSILDVGVDSVRVGNSKTKSEARPAVKPLPSASPAPAVEPSVTPAPVSSPQPELGADASLSLEVVPIIKSQQARQAEQAEQASPVPSATASPHN
jgi:hypothetical protein